jgi:hypothetical protein
MLRTGKLAPYLTALLEWVETKADITIPELAAKMKAEKDATAHSASVAGAAEGGRFRQKPLLAWEIGREDVHPARNE